MEQFCIILNNNTRNNKLTMSTEPKPRVSKIVFIGDSGTGKTSFMERYVQGTFANGYKATIGVDFMMKKVETPGKNIVNLQLWDTAGRERFVTVTRNYYRMAEGVLIFYDITNRDSFSRVKQLFDEITKQQDKENTVKMIIGTKRDLTQKRQVSFEEADELAKHLGALFFEVSAKENINISEAMTAITAELDSQFERSIRSPTDEPILKLLPVKESSRWSFRCNIL